MQKLKIFRIYTWFKMIRPTVLLIILFIKIFNRKKCPLSKVLYTNFVQTSQFWHSMKRNVSLRPLATATESLNRQNVVFYKVWRCERHGRHFNSRNNWFCSLISQEKRRKPMLLDSLMLTYAYLKSKVSGRCERNKIYKERPVEKIFIHNHRSMWATPAA